MQQSEQWDEGSTLGLAISRPDLEKEEGIWHDVLMLFNPFEGDVPFQIPQFGEGGWVLELSTAEEKQTARLLPRRLILFWPGAVLRYSDGLSLQDNPAQMAGFILPGANRKGWPNRQADNHVLFNTFEPRL